jgi:hypothetical protein
MHDVRIAYLVLGEKPIMESEFLPSAGGGCPITGRRAPTGKPEYPLVKFGRMFPPRRMEGLSEERLMEIAGSLIKLGKCIDNPRGCHDEQALRQGESNIPAGYTYLGQFITHEITFHKTDELGLVELKPENVRSPSLDLDSLYGGGPDHPRSIELYEPDVFRARLKVGWTQPPLLSDSSQRSPFPEFQNDLPRRAQGDEKERGAAIVGDERNDENLPLAQTHVAFIRFHNRVVEDLKGRRYKEDYPRPADVHLFDKARAEVVRHFQWIVLKDYLPRIVGQDLVESLTRKPSEWFNPKSEADLFIPLEFSAAAFRIGHSMVRRDYTWNLVLGVVNQSQLFTHTKRSGNLGGLDRLNSTWVIDWKNFYDFRPFAVKYPPRDFSKAGKIDTTFDFRLEKVPGFQHLPQPGGQQGGNPLFNGEQALPVRNLLRGLALGLPWGEDVADELKEKRLEPEQLRDGPHAELLDAFGGKTPLWFYVLKEAKWRGKDGRLGPVGGRIVAETLIGLIRHSRHSILRPVEGKESEWELSDWRPAYGRRWDVPEGVKFEMVDLLRAADVVDPVGKYLGQAEHP